MDSSGVISVWFSSFGVMWSTGGGEGGGGEGNVGWGEGTVGWGEGTMLKGEGEGSMGGGEEFEEEDSVTSGGWGGESVGEVDSTILSSPLRISVCLASLFSLLRRLEEVSGGGELVGWEEGIMDLGGVETTAISSPL